MPCRVLSVSPLRSVIKTSLLIVALLLPAGLVAAPIHDELDGAPYALWQPAAGATNAGILLIIAPGYRPADAGRDARLDPADPALAARHEAGWTLAATAYRRNGWVLPEGVADVAALADHLNATHGPFRLTFVQGSSMGGLIAVKLMEDPAHAPHFAGALALGAALEVTADRLATLGADTADLTLTRQPLRPILFASNRNELAGPLAYFAAVAASPAHRRVAVYAVNRPGHVNLTPAERGVGLQMVHHWAEGEPPTLLGDLTQPVPAAASGGEFTADGLVTRVLRLDPDFGNLDLDATSDDLAALGLDFGGVVGVRPAEPADAKVIPTLVTDRYNVVPRGEWILVVLPDGRLRLAINHGNAAAALHAEVDTRLTLVPLTGE